MSADVLLVNIERRLDRIEIALERLIALEVEHRATKQEVGRAFFEISRLDGRIVTLERDAPIMALVKGLVIKVVWTIVGSALLVVLALVYPQLPFVAHQAKAEGAK